METYKGNKLPKFINNPTLMIFSNYGMDATITEENPDYFDLTVHSGSCNDECLFDLIIFY